MNPYQLAAAPPAMSVGPGVRPLHMQQQQPPQQQQQQQQPELPLDHQQLQDPQAQLRYHDYNTLQQQQQLASQQVAAMIPRNGAALPLLSPHTQQQQTQLMGPQPQAQTVINGAASVSIPTQGMQYSAYVQEMDNTKSQNWDILTGPAAFDMNLSLGLSPEAQVLPLVNHWDPQYGLTNLAQVPMPNLAKARNIPTPSMAATNPYSARAIPTSFQQQQQTVAQTTLPQQRPMVPLQQQQQQQQQHQQHQHHQQQHQQQQQHHHHLQQNSMTSEVPQHQPPQNQQQHQHRLSADPSLGFSDAPSPVPTMPSFDPSVQSSPSPMQIPEYVHQSSTSPEMPIKASPVEQQLSWAPWEETSVSDEHGPYATPAHTHTSFDDGSRDDVDFGPKPLKVFTSSKKDDDGEFRKGQQFYLNIQLNEEDFERYQYIRIPKENIVLPCKTDSNGKIVLNTSSKRKAEDMTTPTSAQEEDVLSLKLITHLEPEHRVVGPCGRCKDKTPEILRFHPGVNGKPMIDENGMVALRDGHVKLIASAWCASTSHHRGPGTKFSFHVELSNMAGRSHPVVVYEGQSDQVEIYASHGRDKGARKLAAEKSTKTPPPVQAGNNQGPPSPAKTISSPPGSPQSDYYDTGPSKKHRKEDPRMTPPTSDTNLAPVIRCLEPSKGPICRENHVIIIGQNFTEGMIPMFGREYGTVIQLTPLYIECSTPRYPKPETVRLWIHHPDNFYSSDKTYEFTDEQAQMDLEQLLRTMVHGDSDLADAPFSAMLERLAGLPSSTSISEQSQSTGSTLLHNSVILGYQAVVSMLIEEGIELDIEDDSGLTALDYAILTNNVEITNILLHSGSVLSYERLNTLTLRPTEDMVKLLMDVSGVQLPVSPEVPDPLAARVPQLETPAADDEDATVPTAHIVEEEEDQVQPSQRHVLETVVEETAIPESSSQTPTNMATPAASPLQISTAPAVQPPTLSSTARPVPATSSRNSAMSPSSPTSGRGSSSHRPESIMTTATGSTMRSAAPTMSTMAPSATSSTSGFSSSSHRMYISKGGVENIWQCAKKGNLSLVKYHLKKDPSLLNKPWGFDGRSALSSACASNRPLELVEYLVGLGANVNHADTHYKRSVLHTLVEHGGMTQDEWIVAPAVQEENEQDVLQAMRFLLDNGAQVDAKNHWKETVLMRLLAARDCPLMVQELYSRGADPRLKSSKDVYPHGTALCYAAFYGRIRSLKWMIENDLLSNDEANIKEAIRWAKEGKGESSLGGVKLSPSNLKRREERRQEVLRMLEGWLGENGFNKRKTLAKEIQASKKGGWWMRVSGIVQESGDKKVSPQRAPSPTSDAGSFKIPTEAHSLWKDVDSLSLTLAACQDYSSSQSSKIKWNPLTILRKST